MDFYSAMKRDQRPVKIPFVKRKVDFWICAVGKVIYGMKGGIIFLCDRWHPLERRA